MTVPTPFSDVTVRDPALMTSERKREACSFRESRELVRIWNTGLQKSASEPDRCFSCAVRRPIDLRGGSVCFNSVNSTIFIIMPVAPPYQKFLAKTHAVQKKPPRFDNTVFQIVFIHYSTTDCNSFQFEHGFWRVEWTTLFSDACWPGSAVAAAVRTRTTTGRPLRCREAAAGLVCCWKQYSQY